MALVFSKVTDQYVRLGGVVLALLVLGGVGAYAYFAYPDVIETGYTPVQPVPYSHKLHVGQLGMDCYYCHNTVYKAAYAAIPPTETCMNCHVRVKPDSKRLEPVRKSYASGMPVEWIKVHKLPEYVYF